MTQETKKFVKWLVIADLLVLLLIVILGMLFIRDHFYERGRLLGKGYGQFILFSNLAAVLIRYSYTKRKEKKQSDAK